MPADAISANGRPADDWLVPAMILAVYQHRKRIDQLLGRLDTPRRTAVEATVAALADGRIDAATLVAQLSDSARQGEGRMRQLLDLFALGAYPDRFGEG